MTDPLNPSNLCLGAQSRAATFENPTGGKGVGGQSFGGRKGRPNKMLNPKQKIILCDLEGPGVIRHIWMTFPPMSPENMRSVWMEVYYDDNSEPSVSVPCLDFFGLPHGRTVHTNNALNSAQEGRGFNAYYPMPFSKKVRIELTNDSNRVFPFYYQVDFTLEDSHDDRQGYLHVSFSRQNPTTRKDDFVIAENFMGPGRYLGCVVGIRVLPSEMSWYGEGEVKMFIDGDEEFPTICGTGLEDYVGTAWGMGVHQSLYGGVPFELKDSASTSPNPDFTTFYRWHVQDPIVFAEDIKVTVQQIGAIFISESDKQEFDVIADRNEVAGPGWIMNMGPGIHAFGLAEREDDFCATAFVYCQSSQPVPRLNLDLAVENIARMPYEKISAQEKRFENVGAITTET